MGRKKQASREEIGISISAWHLRLCEVMLLVCTAFAVFMLVALASYHATDPGWSHVSTNPVVQNVTGQVGAWLADVFFSIWGYLAYVIPWLLVYSAWHYYHRLKNEEGWVFNQIDLLLRCLGFILIMICGCGLLAVLIDKPTWHLDILPGGVIGQLMELALVRAFNYTGAIMVMVTNLMIGITLLTSISWLHIAQWIGSNIRYLLLLLFEKICSNMSSAWYNLCKRVITWWQSWRESKTSIDISGWDEAETVVNATVPPVLIIPPIVKTAATPVVGKKTVDQTKPSIVPMPRATNVESDYPLPGIDLLDLAPGKNAPIDSQTLAQFSAQVEAKLADFGVTVRVVGVYPGPVVTRYELQLAPGTKVSKISGLAKDLARSLSVMSVRVVEVIPGKSYIGLELPNTKREIVALHDIMSSDVYHNSRFTLALALGKDIAGHPVVVDLAKMPHLLVAGTTGSGKSVGLNVMLVSMLYHYTPAELRLIMIDPKMLEFALYDGIPHLLTPVVTDMKDASCALRWCVLEMERRYRLMATLGVRNLAGLNEKINEAIQNGEPLKDPLDNSITPNNLESLPHIVVLADEFADMMVVVGKKVETFIVRLAQKARAAGIHLILATQRPSVDVITGLIKANIPTRISFQVSSKIDSRTVLDQQGAEQLLGHGDMLYLAPGTGVPTRIHGAFIGDDEVHRVVDYLKSYNQADYLEGILDENATINAANSASMVDSDQDELYDEAVYFITKARRVSVSSVQRRFKIGYNRASRIVESMEEAGVVSSMEKSGAREVLAPPPPED